MDVTVSPWQRVRNVLGWIVSLPIRLLKAVWWLVAWPFRWLNSLRLAIYHFFTDVPEDVELTETIADSFESRESLFDLVGAFAEHIEALRGHLLRSVIVLTLFSALAFWQAEKIMAVLTVPLTGQAYEIFGALVQQPTLEGLTTLYTLGQQSIKELTTREPAEGIGTVMRVSLLGGMVLAMPWIITEIFLFIAPGLMPVSRLRLAWAIPLASVLFAIGVAFTYFVMLPATIPFLQEFGGFATAWTPSSYFNLITSLMFWVGIAFQLPLIITALASVGLVRSQHLLSQWRFAILIIAVIAAAITPTTDPLNMALVMLPMIVLYFISIGGAWLAERGLQRRRTAEA
ncbi:MAG: twin-arginine translocase subunit TatC [Anaerolineales bacterium]